MTGSWRPRATGTVSRALRLSECLRPVSTKRPNRATWRHASRASPGSTCPALKTMSAPVPFVNFAKRWATEAPWEPNYVGLG